MFEIILSVIGVLVDVVAIPIALIVNVANHQEAMRILFWSHDVKEWMRKHKPNLLSIFLVVAGFVVACFGANVVWSAWHVKSSMYTSVEEKIGFTVAGGFVYITGLVLYLAVFRKYFRKEVSRGV